MTEKRKDTPNLNPNPPGKQRPGSPRPDVQKDRQVTDPHPDTEEGYDKDRKVPMTGL